VSTGRRFLPGAVVASLALLVGLTGGNGAEEPTHGGKTLTQWQQTQQSTDPSVRWQAAEALGLMGQRNPRAVVRALGRAAGDEDLDVRLQAVAGLAVLKQYAEPAVPALATALRDKDSDLRRQAALALAAVGPPAEEAVPVLGATLRDPNANVRLAAIAALQAIGPDSARALDDLLGCLKDKVPSVRRAGAAALAAVVPEADPRQVEAAVPVIAAALRDTDPEVRRRAAIALRAIGPRAEAAAAALGETARAAPEPARHEAAHALGRIGGKALDELVRNLEHADAAVRTQAAEGLQILGYRARPAFAALARALDDTDPRVRQRAASALSATDPDPADVLPILKRAVEGKADDAGRLWAAGWLGELAVGIDRPQAAAAVGLLTAALADGSAGVRRQAAFALGNVGPEAAVALKGLRDRVNDADAAVRLQVAIALGKIDPQAAREAVPTLIKALTQQRSRGGPPYNPDVANALAAIGAVEPLLETLEKGGDEGTVAGVTAALVRMGPRAKGAFKLLRGSLRHHDAGVRQRGAAAMQAVLPDPKEAVPVLAESLRHEDDYIRHWAAAFLAELGARAPGPEVGDSLEPLTAALGNETTSTVRVQEVRSIGEIVSHQKAAPDAPLDQALVRALLARLADVNPDVRREATVSFGKVGAAWKGRGAIREAIPPLLEELAKGRPFQAEVAGVLGQIGYAVPLVEALKTAKSERVRAGAARALAVVGPDALDHVPALIAAVKDPDPHVRHEVVLALGAIGRPAAAAVPALIAALDDGDYVVPPGAAIALGQLGPEAEGASAALCKALASPAPDLRAQAQAALVAIGPGAVPSLREALKSGDPVVVTLAARAVGRIGPKARAAVPELARAFNQNNYDVKVATAEALAVLRARSPAAVPALALAVGHGDTGVAAAAAALLRELKAATPAVVAAFVNRLETPRTAAPESVALHKLVIQALGDIGPAARPAVPVLLVALDDPALTDDAARSVRVILAPKAGGVELVNVLNTQGQLDDRQLAMVLGSGAADAVPALTELLGHTRARVRAAAARSLGRLGAVAEASRPALVKALTDGNREVRLNAIAALAQQTAAPAENGKAHKDVAAALGDALGHWDDVTRVEAALRIVQVARNDPAPAPALPKAQVLTTVLVSALKAEATPARQEALVDALNGLAGLRTDLKLAGEMGGEDVLARERIALAMGTVSAAQDSDAAVDSLGKALGDRHVGLRRQAALALSKLSRAGAGDLPPALRKVVPALDGAVRDRDRAVRVSAATALWRVTRESDKALPVLLAELELFTYQDGDLVEKLRTGKPVPPVLVELVDMAERNEPARQALVAAMGHDNERVRTGAAVVVGGMKKPPPLFAPPLALMTEDRNPTVRLQATVALRWLDTGPAQQEQVIRRLDEVLDDRTGAVRVQALVTLGVVGPRSGLVKLGHVLESVRDRDDLVRVRAVETLGRFGTKAGGAVAALRLALKDRDAGVRRAAAASLAQVGAEGVPALTVGLSDRDYDVRKHAAIALGVVGPPARSALDALRAASRDADEEVAAAALDALKKVDAGKMP
jgi:HEAT repeat protein